MAAQELAPDALRLFFVKLDSDLDEIVGLSDLQRYARQHHLALDDSQLEQMFASACSKNFTRAGTREPGVTHADLKKATGLRHTLSKVQPAPFRDQWISMIKCVSPNPFKRPIQRPQTSPVVAMYEREEKFFDDRSKQRSSRSKPLVRNAGKVDPGFFAMFAPGGLNTGLAASAAAAGAGAGAGAVGLEPASRDLDVLGHSDSTAALLRSITPGDALASGMPGPDPDALYSGFAAVDEFNAVVESQQQAKPDLGGSQLVRRNAAQRKRQLVSDSKHAARLSGTDPERFRRPATARPKFIVDFHTQRAWDLRAAVAQDQELFNRDPYRAPSATVRQAMNRELDEKSRALAYERRPEAVQEMQRLQSLDYLPQFTVTFKHKGVAERHRELITLERDSYAAAETARLNAIGLGAGGFGRERIGSGSGGNGSDSRPGTASAGAGGAGSASSSRARFDTVFKSLGSLDLEPLSHRYPDPKLSKQARVAKKAQQRAQAQRETKRAELVGSVGASTVDAAAAAAMTARSMDSDAPRSARAAATRSLPFATVAGNTGSDIGALPGEDRIQGLVSVRALTSQTLNATPLHVLRLPFYDPDSWHADTAAAPAAGPAAAPAAPRWSQPAASVALSAAALAARDQDLSGVRVSPRELPADSVLPLPSAGLSGAQYQRLARAGIGIGSARKAAAAAAAAAAGEL